MIASGAARPIEHPGHDASCSTTIRSPAQTPEFLRTPSEWTCPSRQRDISA
jgi:hypothetical protein